LAALLHDISKPETRRRSTKGGDWTFYGHEVVGSRETRKVLRELRYPKEVIDRVSSMVRWHMFFSDPDKITLSAVRRMIANVGPDNIWNLLNVRMSDRIGSGRPKEQPFRLRKYTSMVEEALRDPITVGMLKIDGAQLMSVTHETPGPRIGNMLHTLLEEVLDDPERNSEACLVARARELSTLSDDELARLGSAGKDRKESEEQEEIQALRRKHHVT
jgi:hypothetical protein